MTLAGSTVAGRYDVLAELGVGGMGAVYRAHDRELDELVALKVIRADLIREPDVLDRFRVEVKLARRVTHRNVARTFELGHDGELTFCAMELVDGESLADRLAREGKLVPDQAIAIAHAVCEGLAAAHAAGVIHRDIKPANVLIARDGRVVVADFGIAVPAQVAGADHAGTIAYMAPELLVGGAATEASDIYAVGLVLYEMLVGAHAFSGSVEDMVRKQDEAQVRPTGFEPALADLVARATAREPLDRFASASELAARLAALVRVQPSGATVEPSPGYAVRTVILLPVQLEHGPAHLALALHERVLARLSTRPRVRALARTSATEEPATAVVEMVAAGHATVTIRGPAGAPVVLSVALSMEQLEVAANAVAGAIMTAIEEAPPSLSLARARALELVLEARDLLQRSYQSTAAVEPLLDEAFRLAPDEPVVIATVAFGQARRVFFFDDGAAERFARARALADRALAAAPELAEAQLAAGIIGLHEADVVKAARHFRAAIACAPYAAEPHDQLGRMLLEAGFLDEGLARIQDALAIAPSRAQLRWEVARAWALEGDWEAAEHVSRELVEQGADRWVLRLRFALWRRDPAALARVRAEPVPVSELASGIAAATDAILDGSWAAKRATFLARMIAPAISSRRRAFEAQMLAELAGAAGDLETCAAMIARAADAGAFDLHWLEHCPVLAATLPHVAAAHGQIRGRAFAVLDALYGDAPDERR